jgi:hypothetical protein
VRRMIARGKLGGGELGGAAVVVFIFQSMLDCEDDSAEGAALIR